MPLTSPLNSTNPNRTLSCGYVDTADQIFKVDGTAIQPIGNLTMTCLTQHLTAFGVQEYTGAIVASTAAAVDA